MAARKATVNKKMLIERVAQRTRQKQATAKRMVEALLDAMAEELRAGKRIEFREFGVFEARLRAARRAQNPKTLQLVEVPARVMVRFRPGRALRDGIQADWEGRQRGGPQPDAADGSGPARPQPEVKVAAGRKAVRSS